MKCGVTLVLTNHQFLLASQCGREQVAERTHEHQQPTLRPAAAVAGHRTQTAARDKDSLKNQLAEFAASNSNKSCNITAHIFVRQFMTNIVQNCIAKIKKTAKCHNFHILPPHRG